MKYVLDVSVAICWVIPRPLTPKADRLRDEYHRQIHELLAPVVFIDEAAGALTKAERQKDIAIGRAIPLYAKAQLALASAGPPRLWQCRSHQDSFDFEKVMVRFQQFLAVSG